MQGPDYLMIRNVGLCVYCIHNGIFVTTSILQHHHLVQLCSTGNRKLATTRRDNNAVLVTAYTGDCCASCLAERLSARKSGWMSGASVQQGRADAAMAAQPSLD